MCQRFQRPSPMDNPELRTDDQSFYAGSIDYFEGENKRYIEEHLAIIKLYIAAISDSLDQLYRRRNTGLRFLELGAGTCLTSLSLRKMYPQASFTCVDISITRM